MRTHLYRLALTLALLFTGLAAQADEVVLIVNPANPLEEISLNAVKKIYLGKSKFFPGGGKVVPVDQEEDSDAREIFYEVIIGKSKAKLKRYWSKRVFTGKGTPPRVLKGDAEVIAWVAEEPTGLGYVFKGSVNDSVKILRLK